MQNSSSFVGHDELRACDQAQAKAERRIKVAVRGEVLCVSIYDNAPVHMVSTIDEGVELVKVKECSLVLH